jgi:hypothetical protein
MAHKDIVAKLTESLSGSIDSECRVVYALVEVRKLLQREKTEDNFGSLKFYCEWAAHAELSWKPAQDLVKEIGDLLGKLSDKENQEIEDGGLAGIIYLARFREDLQNCLKHYKIPTKAFDDEQRWQEFLRLYSLVIQDCPLTCKGEGKSVDEVVVTKAEVADAPGERAFETKWELRLKGETVRLFYLSADGKLHAELS